MNVVADTGPIIALAKINQLDLLKSLFSSLVIPPMVHKELMGKFGYEWNAIEKALNNFIDVAAIPQVRQRIASRLTNIDEGERQAISLAYQLGDNSLLIIDDKKGRQAAQKLRVEVTGTVGVLILAKRTGLITEVFTSLMDIRTHGYWFSDEILGMAKRLAGE